MTQLTKIQDRYFVAAQEDRCAPRIRLHIPATLRAAGQQSFPVIVTDLSIAGFACDAVSGMAQGTICWLTLPGMAGLQSTVAWNSGLMLGCAFADLLNGAVLDSIVARHS